MRRNKSGLSIAIAYDDKQDRDSAALPVSKSGTRMMHPSRGISDANLISHFVYSSYVFLCLCSSILVSFGALYHCSIHLDFCNEMCLICGTLLSSEGDALNCQPDD